MDFMLNFIIHNLKRQVHKKKTREMSDFSRLSFGEISDKFVCFRILLQKLIAH